MKRSHFAIVVGPGPLGIVLMARIEKRGAGAFVRIPLEELAIFCHRGRRAISQHLSRLESQGLIERERPAVHSHRLGVRLTAAGRQYLAEILPARAQGAGL